MIDDESILQTFLTNLKEVAMNEAQPWHVEWEQNDRYLLGQQIDVEMQRRKAKWRSSPVDNNIQPLIEQIHSLMCDDRQEAFVIRQAGGDEQTKQTLDDVMTSIWDNKKVVATEYKCKKDSLQYGINIKKVTYDEKRGKKDPLPVFIDRVAPRDFYPDPLAKCVNGKGGCRYIFERVRTALSDLLEEYPDRYEEIYASGDSGLDNCFDNSDNIVGDPEVTVWECYFKDSTMVEEYIEMEDGGEQIKSSKKKYPNGRYVKMVGDLILEDEKNKYPSFPYVATHYIYDPSLKDKIWGLSAISPLIQLQDSINSLEARIFDNITTTTNPTYWTQEGALDEEDTVMLPNSILQMRIDGASLNTLQGSQLPQEVFSFQDKLIKSLQRQSGVNEVTFGSGAQSSRPGTVRQNYNSSITRIRHALRLANDGLAEVGTMILSCLQKFVGEDVMVTLSNPDANITDLVEEATIPQVKQALASPQVQNALRTQQVTLNDTKSYGDKLKRLKDMGIAEDEAKRALREEGVYEFKNDITTGRYEYVVKTHPVQQIDEEALFDLGTKLLQFGLADPVTGQGGVIDIEGFLDMFLPEVPGKRKMVQRILRNQQSMKQQQVEQQAMQQAQLGMNPNMAGQAPQPQIPGSVA